jgi:hypothetical protein
MARFTNRARPVQPSRFRLIVPVAALGIIVACVLVLLRREAPTQTVSRAMREITAIALTRSERPGVDDGGLVGAWWVSASGADPVSGDLHNLVVRSGTMLVAADRARLVIDPFADTFSFEMWDVVFTRVEGADTNAEGYPLQNNDHVILGPVPYAIDIVPDGGRAMRVAGAPGDTKR